MSWVSSAQAESTPAGTTVKSISRYLSSDAMVYPVTHLSFYLDTNGDGRGDLSLWSGGPFCPVELAATEVATLQDAIHAGSSITFWYTRPSPGSYYDPRCLTAYIITY